MRATAAQDGAQALLLLTRAKPRSVPPALSGGARASARSASRIHTVAGASRSRTDARQAVAAKIIRATCRAALAGLQGCSRGLQAHALLGAAAAADRARAGAPAASSLGGEGRIFALHVSLRAPGLSSCVCRNLPTLLTFL